MAWNIPDKGTADNDAQSVVYNTDLDVLSAGMSGVDCVLSGLDFTGGADMTPDISKGAVLSNGVMFAVAAASVTHTTADTTNPRFDLVVVTSAGALAVRAGTPAAAPKPPARTANDVVIRRVYIGAGDTSISTAQSTDMRVFRTQGPIRIAKTTADVTFSNSTSTGNLLHSTTIPNGLLLSGRILRIMCGGTVTNNSGSSQTISFRISYGSFDIFADNTASLTSSANTRNWSAIAWITATADAAQSVNGYFMVGVPGDGLDTPAVVSSPLSGQLTVNSDSANRVCSVALIMNAANASFSVTLNSATLELL